MNVTDAKRAIEKCIDAGRVPFLVGSPGTAKSAISHTVFQERKLYPIDLRLAQCDPTDLNGFPTRTPDNTRMEWVPPKEIPLEGDEIPEGYEGFALFLDEITSANPAMQAAAYKVVLDRMIGQRKLHEKCVIVTAGNKDTDRAVTHRMSTALINRMVRIEVDIELEEWIFNFALPKNIDHRLVAFLRFQPDLFYKFNPNSPDPAYPSARSWDFCSSLMPQTGNDKLDAFHVELIGGVIGHATAVTLNGFLDLYSALPDPEEIVLDPEGAPVPKEPGQLFAVATLLPRKMTSTNLVSVIKYVGRLPAEFQVVTMKDALKIDRTFGLNPHVRKWMAHNTDVIFGDK